jgi:hypothetical protein
MVLTIRGRCEVAPQWAMAAPVLLRSAERPPAPRRRRTGQRTLLWPRAEPDPPNLVFVQNSTRPDKSQYTQTHHTFPSFERQQLTVLPPRTEGLSRDMHSAPRPQFTTPLQAEHVGTPAMERAQPVVVAVLALLARALPSGRPGVPEGSRAEGAGPPRECGSPRKTEGATTEGP